jgi:hypothetical protein
MKYALICILFIALAFLVFVAGRHIAIRESGRKAVKTMAAKRVTAAFDGVDWSKHTFTINGGAYLEAPGGEKYFYKASEIDAAIKRLNAVLNELANDE